ncbi:MAG: hypothetical protein JWQ01_614 [Massilia sp.]|nr:hypothetical protein [Massilia sp.]
MMMLLPTCYFPSPLAGNLAHPGARVPPPAPR